MKLCKDCKHFVVVYTTPPAPNYYGCNVDGIINPVNGGSLYNSCNRMRAGSGNCGPEGKLWEAKG